MKKVTFNTLPEAVGELLERIARLEKLLMEKSAEPVKKQSQIQKSGKKIKESGDKLTVKEAGKFLNITASNLYSYIKNKKIPFEKRNRRVYFSKPELESWSKNKIGNGTTVAEDKLTVKEAEKLFNVPASAIYYIIKSRKIPVITQKGKKLYYSKNELAAKLTAPRKKGRKSKSKAKA